MYISVIVPYNGSANLRYFIRSIKDQTLDSQKYELIIVSENSITNEIRQSIKFGRLHSRILIVKTPFFFNGHTAGLLRNAGAKVAKFKRLVFIDSDCILHPQCLENHFNSNDVCCGSAFELSSSKQYLLNKNWNYNTFFKNSLVDYRLKKNFSKRIRKAEWDEFYSSNCSVPKDLFFKIGGFDESGHRCHDMEFGYRLSKEALINYHPKNSVIHLEHSRSVETILQQRNGWMLIRKKHPELYTMASDRILLIERRYIDTLSYSRDKFLILSRELPGFLSGRNWHLQHDYPDIEKYLSKRKIFWIKIKEKYSIRYYLRIDRNCWDFTIIQRTQDVKPLISVVMPAYNASKTIERAISSVFNQSFQAFELLILDDGSQENYVQILQPYTASGIIRYYREEINLGLSKSLNKALDLVNSKFIVQLDADDEFEQNTLEVIYQKFSRKKNISATYSAPTLHTRGTTQTVIGRQISLSREFLTYGMSQAPRAYNVDDLLRVGGWAVNDAFEGRYFDDALILYKLSKKKEVKFIPTSLYNVHLNHESLSRKVPIETASAKLAILFDYANKEKMDLTYSFNKLFLNSKISNRDKQDKMDVRWSVIMPFDCHPKYLEHTLNSWIQSDWLNGKNEIIIIDDYSSQNISPLLRTLNKYDIKLIQTDKNMGPAYCYNLGTQLAKNEMLFFADADHIVPPDILFLHNRRHKQSKYLGAVLSSVFKRRVFTFLPDREIHKRHLKQLLELKRFTREFEKIVESIISHNNIDLIKSSSGIWEHCGLNSYTESWAKEIGSLLLLHGESLHDYPFKWLLTANGSMSISRKVFLKIGFFNQMLKAMEDLEWGIRASKKKLPIVLAPEAEPYHQVHPIHKLRNIENEKAKSIIKAKHEVEIYKLKNNVAFITPSTASYFIEENIITHNKKDLEDLNKIHRNLKSIIISGYFNPSTSIQIKSSLLDNKIPASFAFYGSSINMYADEYRRLFSKDKQIVVAPWDSVSWKNNSIQEIIDRYEKSKDLINKIFGQQPKYGFDPSVVDYEKFKVVCKSCGLIPIDKTILATPNNYNSFRDILQEIALNWEKTNVISFIDGRSDYTHVVKSLGWLSKINKSNKINLIKLY